ncbi:ParB N-terminal domain-containing protein [Microvirga terrestris]|uniref:ParB N-terminal domain-containing protein n=1 Tax=Microvirga terrestris TaxID=2791024 RepID=UPI0018B01012|nr:ParB N-terminal domain-containing protein [Microvirga terrestris]
MIKDAAFIDIRPGVTARCGLCLVAQLPANPHNARVHSSKQIKKIGRSLEIAGHLSSIIADEMWTILAGHGRIQASNCSGAQCVPVVQVIDLSEAQKRVFLIADNCIVEGARTDRKKLAEQIPELTPLLESIGCQLTDTGLGMAEIDQLTIGFEDSSHNPADEIDPALLQEMIVLQHGNLFVLGEHRLLVGDARERSAADRLMNGEQTAATFLDLPYNVKISSIVGRGKIQHVEFAMGSGEMSRTEFVAFMKSILSNVAHVSRQSAVHFLCIEWKHVH